MDYPYNDILKIVYELEGLLLLAQERGDDAAPLLLATLKDKANQVAMLADMIGESPVVQEVETEDEPTFDELQAETEHEIEPEAEIEPIAVEEPEPVVEETPSDDSDDDFEVAEDEEYDVCEVEVEEEEDVEVQTQTQTQTHTQTQTQTQTQIQTQTTTTKQDTPKVRQWNLRQKFSLNEQYRFMRELFGNDKVEMKETLDLVQAMNSFDEATDYFYNDLGWDANSEEVQDFMEIIRKYFDE